MCYPRIRRVGLDVMRESPDIYGRLKALEGQACAGKWLFNTGPQQIVGFDDLSSLLRAEHDPRNSLISASRDVVPTRYHTTKRPYMCSELLADGSWGRVEREATIQRVVTTVQASYVWPHRRDDETEDGLARQIVNPVLPRLLALARRVLWGQMTELLDAGDPISAESGADSAFDEVRRRIAVAAESQATHLVMHPSDCLDAGWIDGGFTPDFRRVAFRDDNPTGLSLLPDYNCPRGRAVVFDASHLHLGIDEVGAQIRTYSDVSERGYELCVEMVTSVGLWWTHRGAVQEIRGIGASGDTRAAASAAAG